MLCAQMCQSLDIGHCCTIVEGGEFTLHDGKPHFHAAFLKKQTNQGDFASKQQVMWSSG